MAEVFVVLIYKVAVGFAICPNDPNPPTGSKVGGGPTIP